MRGRQKAAVRLLLQTTIARAATRLTSQRLPTQLAEEPGPRQCPSSLDRRYGDLQRVCDFFVSESDEVPQLDDAGLFGIELLESRQRFVECGEHRVLVARPGERIGQRHPVHASPPL